MIKAVIYDLDGTVLDTLSTIAYYANKTLEHFGLSPFETDKYKHFAGNGARVLVERMLKEQNAPTDEYFEKVFSYYTDLYDSSPVGKTKPFDGIEDLILNFNKKGIKQAILSNKPNSAVAGVVNRFFGDTFALVSGAKENIPLKPNPKSLNEMMKNLNVTPDEVLYVGDTSVDIQTGKNANVKTVGVLWGFREKEELQQNGADFLVKHPKEILEIANILNEGE